MEIKWWQAAAPNLCAQELCDKPSSNNLTATVESNAAMEKKKSSVDLNLSQLGVVPLPLLHVLRIG